MSTMRPHVQLICHLVHLSSKCPSQATLTPVPGDSAVNKILQMLSVLVHLSTGCTAKPIVQLMCLLMSLSSECSSKASMFPVHGESSVNLQLLGVLVHLSKRLALPTCPCAGHQMPSVCPKQSKLDCSSRAHW